VIYIAQKASPVQGLRVKSLSSCYNAAYVSHSRTAALYNR